MARARVYTCIYIYDCHVSCMTALSSFEATKLTCIICRLKSREYHAASVICRLDHACIGSCICLFVVILACDVICAKWRKPLVLRAIKCLNIGRTATCGSGVSEPKSSTESAHVSRRALKDPGMSDLPC